MPACDAVREAIRVEFGVDTPVIHRTHAQLGVLGIRAAVPEGDVKFVHAMFLQGSPSEGAIEALEQRLLPAERIALVGVTTCDRLRRGRHTLHPTHEGGAGSGARRRGDGTQPADDADAHRADGVIPPRSVLIAAGGVCGWACRSTRRVSQAEHRT